MSPYLFGPDVVEAQRALGVDDDGLYGPVTAHAVLAWKRSRGTEAPSSELAPAEHNRLVGDVPLRAVRLMETWAAAGVCEEPHGSNRVPMLVALAERLEVAPAYSAMGFPWCAFAVFLAALAEGGRTASLGLRDRAFNPLYTPAVLAEAEAAASGLEIVSAARAFRGDLAFFDWNFVGGDPTDHVGRLASAPSPDRVHTVDGNLGGDGLLALRDRSIATVRAYARDF